MNQTDEELLHDFYAGDDTGLYRLTERHNEMLTRIAYIFLQTRTGSVAQALIEWDLEERLANVWNYIMLTKGVNIGRWPSQRLSVLTWLIHLVCLEMDRHLGLKGPF